MWWCVMNCISVRCDFVFEMCCLEYVINHEGVECDLWLNSWTSDVMCRVLKWCELCQSWALLYLYYYCFIYIIHVCFCLSLFVEECDDSLPVCCLCLDLVMISNLVFMEQMVRLIALKNLMREDARTQCYDRMWYWDISFCFNCMMFQTCYFILFYFAT